MVLGNTSEPSMVVGQTVDDHQLHSASVLVVVDDEILAVVDALVVVIPRDLRRRLTFDRAVQNDLFAVRSDGVFEVLQEVGSHRSWF